MKTEPRKIYLTARGIRQGFRAALLLVPVGLLVAFFGASVAVSFDSEGGGLIFVLGMMLAAGYPYYLVSSRNRLQTLGNDLRVSTAKVVDLDIQKANSSGSFASNSLIAFLIELAMSLAVTATDPKDYYITFEFDARGPGNTVETLRLKAKVSQEVYDGCNLGGRIRVRYARANPRVVYIEGETGYQEETAF